MTTAEILMQLPSLSPTDRRRIVERIVELDDLANEVELCRRSADHAFLLLEAMEEQDAANQAG